MCPRSTAVWNGSQETRNPQMSPKFQFTQNVSWNSTESDPETHIDRMTGAEEKEIPLTFGLEYEFLWCVSNARVNNENVEHWLHMDGPVQTRPLDQIQYLLRSRNQLRVMTEIYPDNVEYERWTLTKEVAAESGKREELLNFTSHVNNANLDDWKTTGSELISRILKAPNHKSRQSTDRVPATGWRSDMREATTYLAALTSKSSDPFFFFSTPSNSSMHIHLGVPDVPYVFPQPGLKAIPLDIMKHIAFIIIQYEDVITAFHHPERRGYYLSKTASVAQSNRFGITRTNHICGRLPLPDIRYIERQIFGCSNLADLARLMNDNGSGVAQRWKFVNWDSLHQGLRTGTLEFRQHLGTTDGDHIKYWVRFIVALFRAAERLYHQETPRVSPVGDAATRAIFGVPPAAPPPALQTNMRQASKYNWPTEGQKVREGKLFELLDLDRVDRAYWTARMKHYDREEYKRRYTWETCVGCEEERDVIELDD